MAEAQAPAAPRPILMFGSMSSKSVMRRLPPAAFILLAGLGTYTTLGALALVVDRGDDFQRLYLSARTWADGGNPASILPVTLDGGSTKQVLGKLLVGCTEDRSMCPTAAEFHKIYANVTTSDPYAGTVLVPISGWVSP
jgi:hypothetical protein